MSNDIGRFEKIINRINIVYGLQLPVGIATIIAISLWVLNPSYFRAGSLPMYAGMIIIVVITSILHSVLSEKLNKRALAMVYTIYHGALILFSIGVAPFLSPFDYLWIALAIGVDLLFGTKRMKITLAIYALVIIIGYIQAGYSLEVTPIALSLVQFMGVAFIATQVSKYRRVSDEERIVLDSTTKQSGFERQRLLSLINNMGEAVLATDESGKVLLYNAAVLNLLDTNETLEGKKIDSLLHLKDKRGQKIKISELLKQNPVGITSTDYVHAYSARDTINLYLNIAAVKLGFKEESESGYIMIIRDITREKSLEEERDEFISVISHELRTPIAIAEGNISNAMFVAEKNKADKAINSAMEQAHDQVVFLANMINDLATLSRAERTDVELEISDINLNDLLNEIRHNYETEATLKKLKLTVTGTKDLKSLSTSELYLKEILQNFITNAIKYTKKGHVLVHARHNTKGDAVFSVSDTGIGLSKADQKRVFDKFFRSEDYRTRESSGTGLGLYVTAKLAHRLDAKINLESELNKGTTFIITVPQLSKPKKHPRNNI